MLNIIIEVNAMTRLMWTLVLAIFLSPASALAQDDVIYYHTDAIGSVRAITDANGVELARYDFAPFGERYGSSPTADPRMFAGKERDTLSELDYFGARDYLPITGRFTTVDPLMNTDAAMTDPQRWNRYSYGNNNPLKFVDPDGREVRYATQQLQTFFTHLASGSQVVRNTLALYAGANNPDLYISQELLADDPVDGPRSGSFEPSFEPKTDTPPGSGNFESFRGLSKAAIDAGMLDGSLWTAATLKGAKLILNTDLNISLAATKGQRERAMGVAAHELGHADSAARDPLRHYRLGRPENQMVGGKRQPWGQRQIERDAEAYRLKVVPFFF